MIIGQLEDAPKSWEVVVRWGEGLFRNGMKEWSVYGSMGGIEDWRSLAWSSLGRKYRIESISRVQLARGHA